MIIRLNLKRFASIRFVPIIFKKNGGEVNMVEVKLQTGTDIPRRVELKKYGSSKFPSLPLTDKILKKPISVDKEVLVWTIEKDKSTFLIVQIKENGD